MNSTILSISTLRYLCCSCVKIYTNLITELQNYEKKKWRKSVRNILVFYIILRPSEQHWALKTVQILKSLSPPGMRIRPHHKDLLMRNAACNMLFLQRLCCKMKVEPWSQAAKAFSALPASTPVCLSACLSEWQLLSYLWHLSPLSCHQEPLVRSTLTTVNHSRASMAAGALATPAASLAPARLVSRDTGVRSALMSARASRARMGVCALMEWMGKWPSFTCFHQEWYIHTV